jgi:hypothetical protein
VSRASTPLAVAVGRERVKSLSANLNLNALKDTYAHTITAAFERV